MVLYFGLLTASPLTGRLQTQIADILPQPDETLRAAQVDEHLVVEQREDQAVARRPDILCARETPLRIVLEPGLRFGQLMISHRVAAAGALPRRGRDELLPMEQLDDRIGRLQPEQLADERKRCRVQRVLVDDVAVAMDCHFLPDRQYRRHVRQRREQLALDAEARQRPFVNGAVDARVGLLHAPLAQLPVGVSQTRN